MVTYLGIARFLARILQYKNISSLQLAETNNSVDNTFC